LSKEILYNALGNRERLSKLLSYPSEIFDSWQYVLIMDQLKELSKTEVDIDIPVIVARLQEVGEYQRVEQVIQDIMLAQHTVNFDYLVGQLVQNARRREIRNVNKDFDNMEEEEWVSAYDDICKKYVVDNETCIEMAEFADGNFDEMFPPDNFVPWRLTAMNEALIGMFKNNFIIVAGSPGCGKTTFVDDEAANSRTLYFQLEVTRTETFAKFLQKKTGIHVKKIIANKFLTDKDNQDIQIAKEELKNELNFKMYDRKNDDFQYIINKIKYELMSGSYELIVIDNLQRVRNIGDGEAGVANLTGTLKQICKDFQVPILGISHLTKAAYTTETKPTLGNLKGGGSYIQDADCIILLYRDEFGNAVFDCQKDRFGTPGIIRGIGFDTHFCKYIDTEIDRFDSYHTL